MQLLKKNVQHPSIIHLQRFLQATVDTPVEVNGRFDDFTHEAVRAFQSQQQLTADGIVGPQTWRAIHTAKAKWWLAEGVAEYPLQKDEYIGKKVAKKTIYLHHTAGRHRPDKTIAWWELDKSKKGNPIRVATAYVIGGIGLQEETDYDGKTYRCFSDDEWAYHLGVRRANSKQLNQESIGIEICSFGPLKKREDGFYSWANARIPDAQVCELEIPWRGEKYFHRYTTVQIAETKRLILNLAYRYDIPLPNIAYSTDWFNINQDALNGESGLWTHVNVRTDKTDCFPQPELIAMLNTLHEDQKTFVPTLTDVERLKTRGVMEQFSAEELEGYARDLEDVGEE